MEHTISADKHSFQIESNPDPADVQRLWESLNGYNREHAEDENHIRLAIFLRDEQGKLVGGLLGDTAWGWLYTSALWLSEGLRKQGIGQRLMAAAEAEAIRRGCRHAAVDTMDFQAPEFYKKLGYSVWGILDDHPGEHSRIFLRKDLVRRK